MARIRLFSVSRERVLKILYICTHNRCRSILSEAVSNHFGQGLIEARSAGSDPAGEVHPESLKALTSEGISTAGLQSDSWQDVSDFNPDVVITVCDAAAGEVCPLWMGATPKLHWGLKDPSALDGTEEDRLQAFGDCIALIRQRLEVLMDVASLPSERWSAALQALGAKSS